MTAPLPVLRSDAAAEAYVGSAELSAFDVSGLRPVGFAFRAGDERVDVRLPGPLRAAVRAAGAYQRFIRRVLEAAVGAGLGPGLADRAGAGMFCAGRARVIRPLLTVRRAGIDGSARKLAGSGLVGQIVWGLQGWSCALAGILLELVGVGAALRQ